MESPFNQSFFQYKFEIISVKRRIKGTLRIGREQDQSQSVEPSGGVVLLDLASFEFLASLSNLSAYWEW